MVAANTTINDFVVGGSDRILNRERALISYPVFWLEHPDVKPYYKGGANVIFQGAFLVLYNADNVDTEEADLNAALNVCFQILTRMADDADAGEFTFDMNDVDINMKGNWSGDNDWGWRVTFDIGGYIPCLGDDDFDDD